MTKYFCGSCTAQKTKKALALAAVMTFLHAGSAGAEELPLLLASGESKEVNNYEAIASGIKIAEDDFVSVVQADTEGTLTFSGDRTSITCDGDNNRETFFAVIAGYPNDIWGTHDSVKGNIYFNAADTQISIKDSGDFDTVYGVASNAGSKIEFNGKDVIVQAYKKSSDVQSLYVSINGTVDFNNTGTTNIITTSEETAEGAYLYLGTLNFNAGSVHMLSSVSGSVDAKETRGFWGIGALGGTLNVSENVSDFTITVNAQGYNAENISKRMSCALYMGALSTATINSPKAEFSVQFAADDDLHNDAMALIVEDGGKIFIGADTETKIFAAASGSENDAAIGINAYSDEKEDRFLRGTVEILGNTTIAASGTGTVKAVKTDGDENISVKIGSAGKTVNILGDVEAKKGSIAIGGATVNLTGEVVTAGNASTELALGNGTWNVSRQSAGASVENKVSTLSADGGKINLHDGGEAKKISIATLSGDGVTFVTDNTESAVKIDKNENKKLTVAAGEKISNALTEANKSDVLQDLADVVEITEGVQQKIIATQDGDVLGALTALTDESGKILPASISEAPNTANAALSKMAGMSVLTWRQQNNDMNKRLGELRASKGEHGAWARLTRGESKYASVKNQYNAYQLGYDEKLSSDPHWTLGAAYTYTDGESGIAGGHGENDHKGFALYGSYLGEDGSFVDLIAKYSRLSNDFAIGDRNAAYDANAYSVSAEYGKRFAKENGFWIEPQAELTYGKVSAAAYRMSNGVHVRQEDCDSFVGRLGFALGKDLPAEQGNLYLRASYLYDFDGGSEMTFAKNGITRKFSQDFGGGWWEVGVGANINMSKASNLYFDVEKTYGGDVATPWQWNLGVRYSF